MESVVVAPILVVGMLFIGLPWLVLHYMTQWKRARSLSIEDENLLDEMYETARRLEERLGTIERIMDAEHPRWRETVVAPHPGTARADLQERPNARSPY